MAPQQVRRVITFLSVCAAIIGFIVFFFDRAEGLHVAIWDVGLMVYGGVFCVVLFMNSIGRQATQLRTASDAHKVGPMRPLPAPVSSPNQRAVVASTALKSSAITLERVRPDTTPRFFAMVDTAVSEVMALEGQRPELDANGQAAIVEDEGWLTRMDCYAFLILHNQHPVGCCVLDTAGSTEIRLLFVETGMRRRGVASFAVQKLMDFTMMIGLGGPLSVSILSSNGRARRFLESSGFHEVRENATEHHTSETGSGPTSNGTTATSDSTLRFVQRQGDIAL